MTSTPRKNVAEKIAGALRSAIVKGRFQPGDPLPSERELAEKYAVNRLLFACRSMSFPISPRRQ